MNVYKMNDCDWMAANNPAEALHGYAEMIASSLYEAIQDGMIDNEIYEVDLDTEIVRDLSEPSLGKVTLRQSIAEHQSHAGDTPFLIASTEF